MNANVSKYDLTICVCTYNAEKYIAETLNSLRKQTYKKFKLLVIDDGSTDRTVSVVEHYAKAGWTDFELFLMSKNRGTAYVRNFALNYVTTKYMMFFDSDDIALPEMIEAMYHRITEDSDLIAVGCFCKYMDSNGRHLPGGIFWRHKDREAFNSAAKAGKMFFMTLPAVFIRDYAINAGGYRQKDWFPVSKHGRYEDLSEDIDLWGRMSDFYVENKWITIIDTPLYYYRKQISSLSAGFAKSRMMGQKMMYIKHNQLRRRANLPEDKFVSYWQKLPWWKKMNFERRNMGGFLYRSACFCWVERKFFGCAVMLFFSAFLAPEYLVKKLNLNFSKSL